MCYILLVGDIFFKSLFQLWSNVWTREVAHIGGEVFIYPKFQKMISVSVILSTTKICTEMMRCCAIMLVGKNSLWMFVRLFSIVCFQMCPLIVCIFTLVAFVFFFSTVCFQMSPQIACVRGCIITLVAFVFFSPLCIFKCLPKDPGSEHAKSHCPHLLAFSPLCVFKCFLKSPARVDA